MKKLLFLGLLLLSALSFGQKINPVTIGRNKIADSISVTVMAFKTTDKTCGLYYEIFDCDKKRIDEGNLQLTEQEFIDYGQSNVFIENITLNRLEFVRKDD